MRFVKLLRTTRSSKSCNFFLTFAIVQQVQLGFRARRDRQLLKFDALHAFLEAPRLVVRLDLAVARVVNGLLVAVVSRDSKGDHEAIFLRKFFVSVVVAIPCADHDVWLLVVDETQELDASVEADDEDDEDGHRAAQN